MMYGYARVSSKEQNEERQLAALKAFGVDSRRIFCDKQSGKDFMRAQYLRLCRRLSPGDVLCVKSIDRLGRNYDEILEQWRLLTKQMHVNIVVLDMPILDTRSKSDLTGTLIADVVLQLLSYVAQSERENIRTRQREGIELALQRGVRFGRPRTMPTRDFRAVAQQYTEREISLEEALAQTGVSRSTFYRWRALPQ